MKKFSILIADHSRHLSILIFPLLIVSIGIYLMVVYKVGHFELIPSLFMGGFVFILYVVPMIVLHIQYYLLNRNDTFEYDCSIGKMIFRRKGKQICFEDHEILKITVFKTRTLAENRTPIFLWDYYNYSVIELKSGEVIKLSSLLVNEIDKVLNIDVFKIRKTLYPWIS
ncbi:hypothetical protein [Algoriphagus antarcticus]|nr:hypothetical protein [Algoriphagus antarcticus]